MRVNRRIACWAAGFAGFGAFGAAVAVPTSHADAGVVVVSGTVAQPAKATGAHLGNDQEYRGNTGAAAYGVFGATDSYVFNGATITGGDGADVSGPPPNTDYKNSVGGYGGPAVFITSNPSIDVFATFNGGTYTGGKGGNATGNVNNYGGVSSPAVYLDANVVTTINSGTFVGGTGGSGNGVPNGIRNVGLAADGKLNVNGGTFNGLYVTYLGKADLRGGRYITGNYYDNSQFVTAGLEIGSGGVVNIYGSNFSVGGTPVGPGVLALTSGTLTGVLQNDTAASSITFVNGGTINLITVPEPACLGLLTVAGGMMAGRVRRRAME